MGSVRWAFPCAAWRPRREEWLLAARLVQPEEKDRIGQFVFARDAKAALAGRLLMRKLIAEKLCIPWNEITLQRTSKGKPFLANNIFSIYSNYNFNVSHQGDYAVLAAEPELQVGIDIMKTNLPGRSRDNFPSRDSGIHHHENFIACDCECYSLVHKCGHCMCQDQAQRCSKLALKICYECAEILSEKGSYGNI